MPSSRQLAAIMFTDIISYTASMGANEQKAFEILNKNRHIQKLLIEQYPFSIHSYQSSESQ
ncbi:MAG: hypothetical protein ICV79_26795 [Flavisolibacter sp.]|nr:hypothetical protein [Flavisolibacter sp.]